MSAVLDYDTLEVLGAAMRDARRRELEDPLPEKLMVLCQKLGEENAATPPEARAGGADGED